MKKYIYLMIAGVFASTLHSCTDDDSYKVEVPVADITLTSPAAGTEINLNEMSVNEYTFSWNEVSEGGSTLVLSGHEHLLNPVYLEAGDSKSHTIQAEYLDELASGFGIGSGKNGTVYWSVKPTNDLAIASREIRTLNVKRLISRLILPEDQKFIALDSERPELPVNFTWDPEGEDPATEYSIVFANNNQMSGELVQYPVGAVKSAGLTQNQLQDVFLKFSAHPFKTLKVYWNIGKKGSSDYLSRTALSIEIDPMMIFRDVRGDEVITYKVAKISYRDGRVQYWLAENLRTKKYPDGTDIEEANVTFASGNSFTEEQIKVYGGYYRPNPTMFAKLPSKDWRMPTITECRELYEEAMAQEKTYNVLRDPEYYNYDPVKTDPKANKWKLGLVTAGQQQGEEKTITNTSYCYIIATGIGEDTHRAAMLDTGAIWESWSVASNVRMVYNK